MVNVPSSVIKEKAGRADATGVVQARLRELDSIRARALLARLDLEADPLAARQGIEVHGRI